MERSTVNSKQSLQDIISLLTQVQEEYGYFEIDVVNIGGKRSSQQRKALEVYCQGMAEMLNDRGIDYTKWIEHKNRHGIETHWTQELFKCVFRDYANALFPEIDGTTAKLNRAQITEAYELVNSRMSTMFGCGMQWPSKEDK